MKKKNLKSLKLNKKSISNFNNELTGGQQISERTTSCYICPNPNPSPDPEPQKCYTEHGGASCGWVCQLTDPNYSLLCSRHF